MTTPQDTPIVPDRKRVKTRQYVALAGIVLVTIGFAGWALWSSFQPKGDVRRPEEKPVARKIQPPAPVDPRDVWIAKSEEELLRMKEGRKELQGDLRELREELSALKAQQKEEAEARKSGAAGTSQLPPLPAPPQPSADSAGGNRLPPPPGAAAVSSSLPPVASPSPRGQPGRQAQQEAIAELVIPLPETPEEAAPSRTIDNYIPAGSFGRAILLSGIDAPTGGASQNNPVPFVVKLKDHGRLPNGFRSRVKACHVVLAGYGDISSERVYARTETLSCVLKDGRILETAIKGYISGEDGKAGMRGRLVSKQGALIARSMLAGVFGGIGEGVSESYQTVTTSALGTVSNVDPNKVFEQGAAQGIGNALDRISKWYLERADETYPVIEADAARIVDIVLTQGASLGEIVEHDPDGPRRALVTEEDRKKAATLEKYPWRK